MRALPKVRAHQNTGPGLGDIIPGTGPRGSQKGGQESGGGGSVAAPASPSFPGERVRTSNTNRSPTLHPKLTHHVCAVVKPGSPPSYLRDLAVLKLRSPRAWRITLKAASWFQGLCLRCLWQQPPSNVADCWVPWKGGVLPSEGELVLDPWVSTHRAGGCSALPRLSAGPLRVRFAGRRSLLCFLTSFCLLI